jgi:hypothetical protein
MSRNLFTVASSVDAVQNLLNYDSSEGEKAVAMKITNDNFMQMTKETLCFVSVFLRLYSRHDRCLSFLSILMKIICKQSSAFHSENCFFIVKLFFLAGKSCYAL